MNIQNKMNCVYGRLSSRHFLLVSVFLIIPITSGCVSVGEDKYQVHDPAEGFNRSIYNLSDGLDKRLLTPVARVYKSATPSWFRSSVSNASGNLIEIDSSINSFLQGKPKAGFNDLSRVVINSTIGIGGLIDVASNVGIDFQEEDLGQTLATAGWNRSAYFYVPVAGPSNARDLPGMAFRSVLPRLILGNSYTWWIGGIVMLNSRAEALSLTDARDTTALDPYAFTREAYYQRRKFLIFDGEPPIDDFFDDFEEDY